MALPSYKDIVDLVMKGATVEAQEKIMALREGALELQEENFALRERIRNLEEALRTKGQITFNRGAYWLVDAGRTQGPYCQHCYDTTEKLVRLQDWGDGWLCFACKNQVDK